jgi:hypothetical protein
MPRWSKRRVGKGAKRRAHAFIRHVGFATLSPPYTLYYARSMRAA